ncbi:ATP synthase F1 subunit gamma [Clostridium amazonitimonense]|uniref:ATP synthase F1 subunit gamma n=1 Tax=Clostridium amazonitimonense TaxID=1499689 RepID=UPI0005099F79|nr:ATP synthase F1 subunit gamma [Clostridium amazonitimonense]
MAGAGLIAIRRRVKSVTNTKKITKAMGLVATAKLRKTREQLMVNNKYYSSVKESFDTLVNSMEDHFGMYFEGNSSNNKLYIVFTSDSGLCGGYNGSVTSYAIERIKNTEEKSSIIMVGQKGKGYFNKLGYSTVAEFFEIPDIPKAEDIRPILDKALELYGEEKVGEINVIYSKFISPVKQAVVSEKLIPFDFNQKESEGKTFEFEPNIEECFTLLKNVYLEARLLNNILDAKASEHSSRMAAMNGATQNANDLLDKLNLKFNRIRQSAITQEISEIVGGAQAQR